MLECVVNISEGCEGAVLGQLALAAGGPLLDVHRDPAHNRSVFTLAGEDQEVIAGACRLARNAVELLDIRLHRGAHPRFGTVDVVPFVALEGWPVADAPGGTGADGPARAARASFATWATSELGLPVYLYGPERSLPEVRRHAWGALGPDLGPRTPHPRAGAVAVGCRPLMVAYNLWLAHPDLAQARAIAAAVRSPAVRALGFGLGDEVQVSCNLVHPAEVGPAEIMDLVSSQAQVQRAELVGLIPLALLRKVPSSRWSDLGLSEEQTIEARLERGKHPEVR